MRQEGNVTTLRLSLKRGVGDVNRPGDGEGHSPLMLACAGGHTEYVRALVGADGIDVNQGLPLYG